MKRTGWYDGEQKPAYIGVYQRKSLSGWGDEFVRWDGTYWHRGSYTIEEANNAVGISASQDLPWRGLTK